jgi:D-glycero-alpha-D-manno-heptose-7-phosphate kinase
MVFVPPQQRMDVIRRLEQFNGAIANCHFTNNATQAWRL